MVGRPVVGFTSPDGQFVGWIGVCTASDDVAVGQEGLQGEAEHRARKDDES